MKSFGSGPVRKTQIVCLSAILQHGQEDTGQRTACGGHAGRGNPGNMNANPSVPIPEISSIIVRPRPFRPVYCMAPAGTLEDPPLASGCPWACFMTTLMDSSHRTEERELKSN